MRYIHFADNNKLDTQDKMTKLPLMNLLKLRFKNHFIPEREIDYDGSTIECYGRHGCKQFISGKPIRFGYKAWYINKKSGYLINFEIYQGTIPGSANVKNVEWDSMWTVFLNFIGNRCNTCIFVCNSLFVLSIFFALFTSLCSIYGTVNITDSEELFP
nr:unnamed protein product [Callosobruchus chinensis]